MKIRSRETGSAVPSRVSLLISIPRLNLVISYGSAYLQSMDCQRESQSKHPTGENPGIYTVGVPFLFFLGDRVPRDTTAAGHADMVMYCLESSRQYPEWEYRDSTMLAAASEQRWYVIDAFDIPCRSINCCTAIP